MRSLSRLHGCAAAVMLIILYFFYREQSIGFGNTVHHAWHGKTHRIVVFGDDWSDTGSYRVSPLPLLTVTARDPDQGELWTETLCKELACNRIDNFARSILTDLGNRTPGSMISSDVYSLATTGRLSNRTTIDFKTQSQQFLAYERENYHGSQTSRTVDDWTIFTVFFGLWELLEFSTLEKEFAMRAIDDSIAELFGQLDLLAAYALTPIKVVLPQMVDITFLSWFNPTRNGIGGQFAQLQHHRVFLMTYWNAVLFQGARQWQNGEIFMPDSNAVLMEQVRAKQLHSEGISDASGSDKGMPLFDYVEKPCLTVLSDSDTTNLQAAAVGKCSDPTAHLFWDDLHLGATAHKLIAKEAATLIRGNYTVDIERATQGSVNDYKSQGEEGGRFNLKFPPDY